MGGSRAPSLEIRPAGTTVLDGKAFLHPPQIIFLLALVIGGQLAGYADGFGIVGKRKRECSPDNGSGFAGVSRNRNRRRRFQQA